MRLPLAFSVRTRCVAALVALVSLGSVGCAANEISWFIQQNQVPQPSGMGGICTVNPDPAALHNEEGTLDLLIGSGYTITPLYRNQLIGYADPMAVRSETRGVFVEGAEIRGYLGEPPPPNQQNPPPGDFGASTVYFSTFIPAGGPQGDGFAVGAIPVVNAQQAMMVRNEICSLDTRGRPECRPLVRQLQTRRVVFTIRPFGRTQGGLRIDAGEFRFAVNFCCGCLLQFPAGSDSMMHPGPDCNEGTPTIMPCVAGQDLPVDCRVCSGSNILCQPPGYTPPGVMPPCPNP